MKSLKKALSKGGKELFKVLDFLDKNINIKFELSITHKEAKDDVKMDAKK